MKNSRVAVPPRRRAAVLVAFAAIGLCLAFGCSTDRKAYKSDPPAPPKMTLAQYEVGEWATRRSFVPASLSEAGMRAEAIFSAAAANDWPDAQSEFRWFATGVEQLNQDIDDQEELKGQLSSALMSLGVAINAEDRLGTLGGANSVIEILVQMEGPLSPVIPIYVKLMGVYGRQIQLVAPSGNTDDLAALAYAIHTAWYIFRPQVALMSDDVATFDSIVSGLDSATLPGEYEDYARQLLSAVSGMESHFREQAAGAY